MQDQLQWWPMLRIDKKQHSDEEMKLNSRLLHAPSAAASLAILRHAAEVLICINQMRDATLKVKVICSTLICLKFDMGCIC